MTDKWFSSVHHKREGGLRIPRGRKELWVESRWVDSQSQLPPVVTVEVVLRAARRQEGTCAGRRAGGLGRTPALFFIT